MAEQTKKAAPKRKAAPRKTAPRKAAAKKTAPRKSAARKTTAKRKAAPKSTVRSTVRSVENKAAAVERDVRKAGRKAEGRINEIEKSARELVNNAQETSRNAFLASLGFYGKAFDQVQDQFNSLQSELEARRAKADKQYKELIKRGKKVEKDAKGALEEIELPKLELDSIADRKKLDARLKKVKARFEELRDSVGFKSAA
jgi:hypothetical protein